MMAELPQSPEQVLEIVLRAEQHRKFVWTAGRVLKEASLWTRVETLEHQERKSVLQHVTKFLEELAAQGVLKRRHELQSIGYGGEIGFDFVGTDANRNPQIVGV